MKNNKLITILGPTACGKTQLACRLAKDLNGEIISADSRQVYRGMDIGTGKDIEEYTLDTVQIPFHLIDIKDAGYQYNIAEYQLDFHQALNKISEQNKTPILCGGSGMYIEAALKGNSFLGIPSDLDEKKSLQELNEADFQKVYEACLPDIREAIGDHTKPRKIRAIQVSNYIKQHPNWEKRNFPETDTVIIGLDIDRNLRREKITDRLSYRLNNGLIEEAQQLLENGLSHEQMAYYGLEYKWLSDFLQGKISKKELFFGLNTAIHQFSKRQMTWFRRMEKNGYEIHWLDASLDLGEKLRVSHDLIEKYGH